MESTLKLMTYSADIGTLGEGQESRHHSCQLTEHVDIQNLKYLKDSHVNLAYVDINFVQP